MAFRSFCCLDLSTNIHKVYLTLHLLASVAQTFSTPSSRSFSLLLDPHPSPWGTSMKHNPGQQRKKVLLPSVMLAFPIMHKTEEPKATGTQHLFSLVIFHSSLLSHLHLRLALLSKCCVKHDLLGWGTKKSQQMVAKTASCSDYGCFKGFSLLLLTSTGALLSGGTHTFVWRCGQYREQYERGLVWQIKCFNTLPNTGPNCECVWVNVSARQPPCVLRDDIATCYFWHTGCSASCWLRMDALDCSVSWPSAPGQLAGLHADWRPAQPMTGRSKEACCFLFIHISQPLLLVLICCGSHHIKFTNTT